MSDPLNVCKHLAWKIHFRDLTRLQLSDCQSLSSSVPMITSTYCLIEQVKKNQWVSIHGCPRHLIIPQRRVHSAVSCRYAASRSPCCRCRYHLWRNKQPWNASVDRVHTRQSVTSLGHRTALMSEFEIVERPLCRSTSTLIILMSSHNNTNGCFVQFHQFQASCHSHISAFC